MVVVMRVVATAAVKDFQSYLQMLWFSQQGTKTQLAAVSGRAMADVACSSRKFNVPLEPAISALPLQPDYNGSICSLSP